MKRIALVVLLVWLSAALTGAGFWAKQEAMMAELSAAFAYNPLFSPVAPAGSIWDEEDEIEFKKRADALAAEHNADARLLTLGCVVSFVGASAALLCVVLICVRSFKARRAAHNPRMESSLSA